MKKICSIFSLRTLTLVCALFAGVHGAFAVYFETIEKNKDFYIYNVFAQKYIKNNNGQMTMVELSEASTWQFSGTSGDVTVKNGSHCILTEGHAGNKYGMEAPDANATGPVSLTTSSSKMSIGGSVDGYLFSIVKKYGIFGSGGSRTFYFAYNGSVFVASQSKDSNQSKWKLVSKRQLDNTITLSHDSLALEAIQGGEPASSQFFVNYSGNPTSIILTNGTNTLTVSSPDADGQHTVLVSYQVDSLGTQTFTLTDGSNAANKTIFSFAAGASASLGLTVSTTAASGDAIEADKKTMTIKGTVSTLKHQYIDWTQDFSALSLTTAPIVLNAVARTTGGVATERTITYSLSSTGVVKVVKDTLYVLSEGTTTITAKVAKDATYVGAEKSLTIHVIGVPTSAHTITASNASSTGIYTGTIGGPSDAYIMHRATRQVDLQKCFNNGGQALFDTLYIFGITTNTDGELVSYKGTDGKDYANVPVVNWPHFITEERFNVETQANEMVVIDTAMYNATTPCYVFYKSEDTVDTYVYTRTFDATKKRYDWGVKQNGKHIYFTGYCPFAYMGVTSKEEGWMYFTGGNENVDIYLDSCQIMGRYKTQSGMNYGYEQYTLDLYASAATLGGEIANNSYTLGMSAPFVFTSTVKDEGKAYKPHIHIAGRNHLQGQLGPEIKQTMAHVDYYAGIYNQDAGIGGVFTYTSPIVVKPTDIGQYTELELTDIWKDNTITNGYLKLDANKGDNPSEKVPSIDLGSKYGSLTINGGQYHLRNAAADGQYACNLAVSYRQFSKMVTAEVPLLGTAKILLHLYGFGGDMPDAKVVINSGTFTMYANMYPSGSGYLGTGYYKDQENYLDLRLPAGNGGTQINGGTFNGISNVFVCNVVTSTGTNPKNGYGDRLCLREFEVTEEKQLNGSVNFTLPELYIEGERVYEDPQVVYDITDVDTNKMVVRGELYGGQSVNAYTRGDKRYVNLLLAGEATDKEGICSNCTFQDESIIYNWATALPLISAKKQVDNGEGSASVGGSDTIPVKKPGENVIYQVNQLLYVDLQGMEPYTTHLESQNATLVLADKEKPRGEFKNSRFYDESKQYEIRDHLNIIRTFQADTWYTFTAPFDIHDLSVVETLRDAEINEAIRDTALAIQARDNMGILYELQNFIIPNEHGRASSLTLNELLANPAILKEVYGLTHYDGRNLMDANYYLYELEKEEFGTSGVGESLDIKWQPVKRDSLGDPLMYQGKTYAIQFPWCPMCNDLESRTYYDYWSNKMIVFHGNGPQGVYGKSPAVPIVEGGQAALTGNVTFMDQTISSGYAHNQSTDFYEEITTSYTLKPTEGYLLFGGTSQGMPSRISRAGEMVYDSQDETGLDGLPTIGDRSSLMLFDAENGVEVLSLRNQWVAVYNTQGNLLYHGYMTEGQQEFIALAVGIYVVKGENEAIKILVD